MVPSNRRPAPRGNARHLFVVPDDAQPALWDSRELRRLARLRQLAVDTGAPEEAIRLIEAAATADEALEELVRAGLMASEPDTFKGMLSWFTPVLEPGCDQLDAELCGASFIGELRRASPPDANMSDVLRNVLDHVIEYDTPEALAMARIMAVIGPPDIRAIAADRANRMALSGRTDMPWTVGLGMPQLGPCFGYGDIYGAQLSTVLVFSYAGKRHALIVLTDYLLGGGIKDCYLVDYTSKIRDYYRTTGADPDLSYSDLDTVLAREILDEALSKEPCPVNPEQIEHVENHIDLLRARVELLPLRAAPAQTAATRKAATRIAATGRATGARAKRAPGPRNVHRLKVTLRGTKPPIWRRFEVPSDSSLARLHTVIQLGFGWQNSHLYVFETPAGRYGSYDPDLEIRSAANKKLSAVADWPGDKIRYEYDFGDSWEHDVAVEAVEPAQPGIAYPRCTGGKRAGPPEDSGGIWGYSDLLNTLANPRDKDHAQVLRWLGIESAAEFDPDRFDLDAAQKALAGISKVLMKS
jgi:hypothetical protein